LCPDQVAAPHGDKRMLAGDRVAATAGFLQSNSHDGCKGCTVPKTRTEWWQAKFERNVANDRKHQRELEELGWRRSLWFGSVNFGKEISLFSLYLVA